MSKVDVPETPNTRKEAYLAAIAGQAVEVPAEPITREEAYLDAILNNGGGGGGGGDTVSITPTYTEGIKVADYSINGENGAIYIPTDPSTPKLRLENIYSLNDTNEISANFTAQNTSEYILIMAIGNASTEDFPEISTASVTVNENAKTVNNYYSSKSLGYGIDSKIAFLSLNAGDTVSAMLGSSAGSYSTSAFIALIRISEAISNLTLKASDCEIGINDADVEYIADSNSFYLLFFFSRFDSVGEFDILTRNNEEIRKKAVICSSDIGWQLSHGICAIYANNLDELEVAVKEHNGVCACGVMSFSKAS